MSTDIDGCAADTGDGNGNGAALCARGDDTNAGCIDVVAPAAGGAYTCNCTTGFAENSAGVCAGRAMIWQSNE